MNRQVIANRYEIVQLLGRGDFGEVYEAIDLMLGSSRVALKFFKEDLAQDPKSGSRFGREVLAMTRVQHPNVIRFFDIIHDESNRIGYSMELVRGASLGKLIDRGPRFTFEEIRYVLSQICQGTQAIHSKALVHRDLKPENVIVTENGTCKIVDFGVAHLMGWSGPIFSEDSADFGSLCGTPDYMSPEMLTDPEPNPASDVYAIGIIGYQLITGEIPFEEYPLIDSLKQKLVTDPSPPIARRSSCPSSLSEVIRTALKRSPADRYPSPAALQAALEACDLSGEKGGEEHPALSLAGRVARSFLPPDEPALEPEEFRGMRIVDLALIGTLFSVVVLLAVAAAFPQDLLAFLALVKT